MAKWLLPLYLLAIALKFWLIWESEIIDATDDSHEYVLQILYPVNGGLSYPPGTGIAGRFLHTLHVPYRLGLEAGFLLGLTLLLRSLFAWPWRGPLALVLFGLAAFDPAIAALFSHLYSDQAWLVEVLLGLSLFIFAFQDEEQVNPFCLFGTVAFITLAFLTRSTVVPLLLGFIIWVLLALLLILARLRSPHLRRDMHHLAKAAPLLIIGLCLTYGIACRYNYLRHGYTGLSYIDSREYKNFYVTLQSVGDPDGPPYFPVDENRRRLIAQAGPVSHWFIEQIEANAVYKQTGIDTYGRKDIPAGWFHWAAFTATVHDGDYMGAFSIFRSIEQEIADASQKGIIRIRHVAALPDCRVPMVLAALPDGFLSSISKMVYEPAPVLFLQNKAIYLDPDFDQALNRRTVVESPVRDNVWAGLANLYAWIYTPALFVLYVAAQLACPALLLLRRRQIDDFPLLFLARQSWAIFFFIILTWYSFFDASGMPVIPRYVLLNHVLLPVLLAYYLTATLRFYRMSEL